MGHRLSTLDGSFLRIETPSAHMHVAWLGVFDPPSDRPRPTLEALRAHIQGRLGLVPRFGERLAFPPLAIAEPTWAPDRDFDITQHVVRLAPGAGPLPGSRFGELADAALSEPLDRERPLWRVYLVPELEDGRIGIVVKMHHAMVDGKSAVALGLLLLDVTPDAEPAGGDPTAPAPTSHPGPARLALDALVDGAATSLRTARGAASLAAAPRGAAARLTGTLRRAALAGEDLMRPAPSSYLNVPIGPRRTLAGYRAPMDRLLAVRRSAGVTLNDACLAVVTGGLRELALARGRRPGPLKAMVPVSVRQESEGDTLGNRISFAFVDLPVQLSSPRRRLEEVHAATAAFKRKGAPAGASTLFDALGILPGPVKDRAARLVGSARVYNLTISNVPGPDVPLYLLGAELAEAYPVVPIADGHTLSIGIFTHRDSAFFGVYADPEALPDARELPAALHTSLMALEWAYRRPRRPRGRAPGGRRNGTPAARRPSLP
jgi:WS/DGAT/MGAT family acyltransferase